MSIETIVIIIILLVLFGGGGGYWYSRRTVILNVIRDEADVEDVLHDVMLQLWEQAHRYNSNEKGVRELLVTLARRRSLDRRRRRSAYLRATESLKSDTGNSLRFEASPTASQVEIN